MEDLELEIESSVDRKYIECGACKGKGIAVLTSGGDAQGMNAALRAVVRTALFLGCNVFFVMEGYQGLIEGTIVPATWVAVSSIIHKGGTIIGSARSSEFQTREGRLKAAKNLAVRGINNLVVIGGDGSLTGANIFRTEWSGLLEELLNINEIDSECIKAIENLQIIGIVGSIDNDFCGTDMTIGTDSALRRILEAIDAIICTAYSHQRTFILEVMGRRCGYLALSAGLLSSATAVFIPEEPVDDWENKLCEKIEKERENGTRLNIIIVAEGAIGAKGTPLTAEMIRDVVVERLKHDTRITVLGHIQRGGTPSAFDRVLGCRMGVEAVLALMEADPDSEPRVITLNSLRSIRLPLMQCVEKTHAVAKALDENDYELARKLRGRAFLRRYTIYNHMFLAGRGKDYNDGDARYTLGVVHVGAPACGMNAAVMAFVRCAVERKCKVLVISEGIEGLLKGNVREIRCSDVTGWVGEGGALIGTKRTLPRGKFREIADQLRTFSINGLFLIGGFEAYQTALDLYKQRANFPEFCIPLLVAPATISNNVPGSDLSIGSDTALNEIVEICDRIRLSAQGTQRRVFVCEVMGGYCGYLASLAGLAGGADAAYIYEEIFSIKDLQRDLYNMASKMCAGVQRGLILRNEKCSDNYNCDFMTRLYAEEGKGIFSARSNIIGHIQQGRTSSPFDRNLGITFSLYALDWFIETLERCATEGDSYANSDKTACVLGVTGTSFKYTPVTELVESSDFHKRLSSRDWWMSLRPIMKVLSRHESIYEEGTYIPYGEPAIDARLLEK